VAAWRSSPAERESQRPLTLAALHGWSNEGSWQTIDTSMMNGPGVYQLNLSIDGSGTVITIPQIAAGPELMRLDSNGTVVGDYARIE
jgi:hypothetical protein